MDRYEASAICQLFIAAAGAEGVCVVLVVEMEEGGRLDEALYFAQNKWQGRG